MIDKAKQKFKELKTPLLFFFDEEQEYSDTVESWSGDDFKIVTVDDNYFWIKYMIATEWKDDKILLYHRYKKPVESALNTYPLLDLLLANQVLLIDEIAELMDKYFISYRHQAVLTKYRRFVKAAKYRRQLEPFFSAGPSFDEDKFRNAIVSILLNENRTGNKIFNLIAVFETMNSGEKAWKKVHSDIDNQDLSETLLSSINSTTNIHTDDLSYQSLQTLFLKLKYNAITKNISDPAKGDSYAAFKVKESLTQQYINIFFNEWQENKNRSKTLHSALSNLGADIDAKKLIDVYGIETEYGLIAGKLTNYKVGEAIAHLPDNPDWVIKQFASWRNNPEEHKGYEDAIKFLLNSSHYFSLLRNYTDFDFNHIIDYIDRYKGELHKLDLYYRKAFTAYRQMDRANVASDFSKLFGLLNNSYDNYLKELNISWLKILQEQNFDLNQVDTAKQYNFYRDFIQKDSNKKVVIISDAFRYELAADLLQELTDPQNSIELTPMLTSIPSVTSLGMSNLLPNNGITADTSGNSIEWMIAGEKTVSSNREKILKSIESESVTIRYSDFIQLSIEEQRTALRDKRVVYIYHNWMDTIGDDVTSEHHTFESAKECISQLYSLVERLYRSLNTYNILLTADHGFLFNYETISDASKQPLPKLNSSYREHSRYCITADTTVPADTLMFPLRNTTNIETDLNVVIPKGINRFRKQGSGVQFVHGGASLQELIVPVLSIYRIRRSNAEDVSISRIDTTESMSASSARFRFLQDKAISEGILPVKAVIALYDLDNNLISSEALIEFNSTDSQPTGRSFEISLELNNLGSRTSAGYLKVYKSSDVNKLNELYKSGMIKINTLTEIDEF